MAITAGARFDRYQIASHIGSGGMGEIYLAQDTRLGRKVALKLLPLQYTQDAERLRRFEQEAYAASALNHPNIITIYEIGEAEGRHFIAAEFIEGATLRRRLTGGRLSIKESLDIAVQVVGALATAHAAGIIHRDIKPENIMIRPDGYVKVLDFGLAKLTERPASTETVETTGGSGSPEPDSEPDLLTTETAPHSIEDLSDDSFATVTLGAPNETAPGLVMGTAQYMSPEQARGLRVDARTDIFSFGIVLYEMIAGKMPFSGGNKREIISSMLNREPPPLVHYQPDVPEVLEWITHKALIKDRDERYQTAKEMLNDLKRIQHRLNVEREVSRSRILGDSGELRSDEPRALLGGYSTEEHRAQTGYFGSARDTGYFAMRSSSLTRRGMKNPLLVALVTTLLVASGFGLYQMIGSRSRMTAPFQPMQVRRFTTSGKATRAAISPDGKYVVHVVSEAGKQCLLVRQVTASNNVEIVPPAEVVYRGLTFSHDGNYVFYVVQEQNNPIQVLYQAPVLGGVPRKILVDIDSPISISPDGKQFAFVRRVRGRGEDELLVADIDGKNLREIASRKGPDFFGVSGPAWSPDGRIIAAPAGTNTGGRQMFISEVHLADGKERPVSPQRWTSVGRVSWMSNGRGLIISATEKGATLAQVWYLPYPKGSAYRVTNDLNDYRDMSLTDDSRALVTIQSEALVNVWLMPGNDPGRARQITDGIGQYNGVRGLTWLPDGRLAYVSRASSSQDIWLMDQNGKNNLQLTTPETRADIYPAVSPDGRYIVFVSTRTGNSNLYRLDLTTNDQIRLTNGTSEEFPTITADGKWVIYTATGSTNFRLWKISIDGGEPVRLTDSLSQWPVVSPDGQTLACWYREVPTSNWKIAIIPITGGSPVRILTPPASAETSIPVRWMPDGKGISFADTRSGISNIWTLPLDGSAPRQLTFFTYDLIYWFEWSRDGKQLACSRGRESSDVVLINQL